MSKIILVVAAHPDDEVLGCAGTIAKHVASGDIVHVIFMTNGVSSRNESNHDAAMDRKIAAQKSSDILGVKSIQYFDFPDNKMDEVPLLNIVKLIENVIHDLNPRVIYTHHIGDLNIDHQIVHRAVVTSCRPLPGFCVKEVYAFEVLSSTEWQTPGHMIFSPNVFVDISKQIKIKQDALACYAKEMHKAPHGRSAENSIRLASLRGNSVGVNYAEAFVSIREIR